jgi:hypothetical protein
MGTRRRSTKRSSVIVMKGRAAKGRSENVQGAPGESATGAGGTPAQGGRGGSASAKGGAATAGSVKLQTPDS